MVKWQGSDKGDIVKKTGIITIYDLDNYGNRLQNYAVRKTLENLNVANETIDFIDGLQIKVFLRMFLGRFLRYEKRQEVQRNILFKKFTNKWLTHKYYYRVKDRSKYSAYVCGSDQIWNPNWGKQYRMFAQFAPIEKRVSYSASFGVDSIPKDKVELYTNYLQGMKHISVREEAGYRIVQQLTGRNAAVLIDPTLMLDKRDWEIVSSKPKYKIENKYLLTYFLGEISSERNSYIERIAREYKLDIIRLESKRPLEEWYRTGPSEFIWLIEHCTLMCTDSFHGTIFSVLLDVPFIVFSREDKLGNMNSRIDTLLSTLHLEDRHAKRLCYKKVLEKNYNHVPSILQRERKKVVEYLSIALELDK